MIINHNMNAMNAHRNMSANTVNAGKSMEKLSSGLRINKAGDDAAGLAISEKMRGQIRGLDQAGRNSQDAISLIQTAEGALNETHSILQRMRELSVQSSNDTSTADDRAKIQSEVDELAKEITRISNTTEFNTQTLLNGGVKTGNKGELTFQIGANTDQNIDLNINAMDAFSLGVAGSKATANVTSPGTANVVKTASVAREAGTGVVDNASVSITAVNKTAAVGTTGAVAIDSSTAADTITIATTGNTDQLNGYKVVFTDNAGALGTNVDTNNKTITVVGDFDGGSAPTLTNIKDNVNLALTASGFTAQLDNITLGGSAAVSALSSGDNALAGFSISGGTDGSYTTVTLGGTQTIDIKDTENSFTVNSGTYKGLTVNLSTGKNVGDLVSNGTATLTLDVTGASAASFTSGELVDKASTAAGINVSTQESANSAITSIDNAIKSVSEERSKLGAYQNRLEHTINQLGTSSENLTAAESRIRDVDMAKEMMTFSKNNILSQAAQAMLAQANQQPQGVLQLLR